MKHLFLAILISLCSFSLTFGQDSLFSAAVAVREIPNPDWVEISGMAASKLNPDWLYIHNDSGGENAVFVMSTSGEELGKVILEGVSNRDWEDIAVGPGPEGKSYVYVAEIGDNLAQHEEILIYRFPEPKQAISTVKPETARFQFPEGAMDAEAIFVDPISGKVYLISKRNQENTLFEMPTQAFEQEGPIDLVEMGTFPFTSTVAADISQAGDAILVKTYFAVYYWQRESGTGIPETLAKPFKILLYTPEPQGESIAFQADGKGYFTLSEERFEIKPVLYHYLKQK
ncbi:hypothetical protein ACFOSV_00725 [Algoriphagus namhaensis]|uniref:PE-PGRS family protein n=1 Tax=Algoriphagus namhaensis TaxID=915353 RepID=A0ABV8APA4_9BACT